ncbi:MAG: ferrous iron transporter B [Proteobacteria bacterium]|nr:ferrous iron transporter B [Pseudomonadota bacterium]
MAIIGNVSIGKTCLFDLLCAKGEHSVNIPGSTLTVNRGVLAIGHGGASRPFRRQCSSCGGANGRRGKEHPCHATISADVQPLTARDCPALKGKGAGQTADTLIAPLVTHLYDTPGSTTLAANSEDEMVARDLMLSGHLDGVVVVADAKNMRRSMAFALEAAEFGLPMVIDLNMLDESESMGIEVDDAALAREMGVPVGRTVATEKRGVRQLAELILDAQIPKRHIRFPKAIENALGRLEEIIKNPVLSPRALGFLLLSGDRGAESWVTEHLGEQVLGTVKKVISELQSSFNAPLKSMISDVFYSEAEQIVDRTVISTARSPSLLVRFGNLAQRPLSGGVIGLGVLILAYGWVGAFGATFVVDNLSARLFENVLIPGCDAIVKFIPSEFVRDAIMDPDFGLLPTGLFLAIGIVLPVLFCFYSLQAVLEDSGYLPRLAVLFDRALRRIGLNGQGLIPLVLGFSCIAMAVITTRMLPTRKERNILSLLVIGIPCAPLFAVFIIILGKMPWTAGAVIFGLIGIRIALAGYVASKVLPGDLPDLILEIPQMRIPRLSIIWSKTWRRTWEFMREAVPIFLLAAFVVFVFDRAGGLAIIEDAARPLVNGLLGLPDQAVQVFIKTAIRRENGATELEHLRGQFTNLQLIVTMLVMTFVMPCINTAIVILKERGLKACLAILTFSVLSSVVVGALVNLTCRSFGITFSG